MWKKLKSIFSKFSRKNIFPSDANLEKLRKRGLYLQKLNPDFSFCHRCYHPWNHCNGNHSIKFSLYKGYFALCETCWNLSTTEERLMYYTQTTGITTEEKQELITNLLKECGEDPKRYFREKKLKRLIK